MMSVVTTKKPIDLDALLREKHGDLLAPREEVTTPVTLFGEEFEVVLGVSVVGQMNMLNPNDRTGVSRYLLGMIAPKDQDRFTKVLEDHPALRGDPEEAVKLLFTIIENLTEVASGSRPTTSSSASPSGTRKKAAVKRSAAS
jgi:hypothetical protein